MRGPGYRIELRGETDGVRFDEWTPSGLAAFERLDDAIKVAGEARDATRFSVRVVGPSGYVELPARDADDPPLVCGAEVRP